MKNSYFVIAIALGGFLSLYNSVAMNIAIPTFVEIFQTDLGTVQWIMISYTLMMGVLSPTAGYFSDKFSCRNVFVGSMLGFAVAALCSGFCTEIYQLIVIRLFQGALAAFIIPCSMMMIYQYVPVRKKETFLTLQGMSLSMGPAIGPVISGLLVTLAGWQWMFWINIPIALMTAWAAYRALPYEKSTQQAKLDYLSFAYVISGTVLFLLSFNQASVWGFTSPLFWLLLAIGSGLIALFIRRCLHSTHPVLNFHILNNRDYSITLIINSCVSMALCLVPFSLAIYFQNILGYSPLLSGMILLIPAIFSILGGPSSQWLYSRMDSKKMILISLALIGVGSFALGQLTLQTGIVSVLFWLCIRYLGIGVVNLPLTDYGMSAIGRNLSGHGSSLLNWCKMMSTSLSLSVFTMVLSMRTAYHRQTHGAAEAQLLGIDDVFVYSAIILAMAFVLGLRLVSNKNLTRQSAD